MDEQEQSQGTPSTNGAAGGRSMAPVLAGTEARVVERGQSPAMPPVPVVAAAAGGAVVGAFMVFLLRVVRRPGRQPMAVRIGKGRGRRGTLEVTGSRSFLVDVHMLKR